MSKINLKKISGQGFLAFYDPFEFVLSNYEGQSVQIDGFNKDDNMSESNGSGKSSLLEAIGWGWYGELCRKNRYNDEIIYNRNGIKAKFAIIESEFDQLGSNYRTERIIHWKKSPELRLWIEGEEILEEAKYQVKQQHLENVLGMNFTAFQCCTMFGRDFMNFPDLKPNERGKVLTDIRGLNKYVIAVRICNDKINELQTTIMTNQSNLRTIEGRILQLREMNYKNEIQEFETQRQQELQQLKKEEQTLQNSLKEINKTKIAKISELQQEVLKQETQQQQNTKLLTRLPKLKAECVDLEKQITQLQTNSSYLSQELKILNQELIQMQKLGMGKCSLCHQLITAEHLAKEMDLYDKKSDDYNQQIKNLHSQILSLRETLTTEKNDLKHLESIQETNWECARLISNTKITITNLEKSPEEERIKSQLSNTQNRQKMAQNATNPYVEQEEKRKTTIFTLVNQTKDQKQIIAGLEMDSKYYQFWVEGFKKIRLMLFGTMIDRFQDYAQSLLSQYTSELQIQFSTERETRSGTIKDEFDISITDSSETTLSYEMYSGGERQKIRLSIARALAEMIKDDCGKEFNFEGFDEPNDSLDDVGKEINFDIFTKLAEEGKAVLVTDHDSIFKDKFDRSITVVKEHDKSHIQL
jgi:DNA repair exonuclease SbcCD ATPase subunit